MADLLLAPYIEALDEFPLTGTREAKLRAAVRFAVRAPSSHNTQPWIFRVADGALELYADRSRGLPVVDPEDRELVISCGAALYHLRLALAHFGCATAVDLLPDASQPDLLARVTLAGEHVPTDEEHALFDAMQKRRTNRRAFEPRALEPELLNALIRAAAAEGAALRFVLEPRERDALADLVARADAIQMADRRFRRELALWLRPNLSRRRDGMPGFTQGLSDLMSAAGPFVVRTFDLGKGRAARDHDLARGSPALAILETTADQPADWLAAGQALARLLLRATVGGASASFLNQPVEVPELRLPLAVLAGDAGYPQIVLRLGYGRPARRTPRRPVSEVIES